MHRYGMRAMGAKIHKDDQNIWYITGVGAAGLQPPAEILDMGNSGTSARLLIGLVSGKNFTTRFTGDTSLRNKADGAGDRAFVKNGRAI